MRTARFSYREARGKRLFPKDSHAPAMPDIPFLKERDRTFVFFPKRKGSKRKSLSETRLGCSSAGFANVIHKTDDSHTNRPFFVPGSAGSRPICKTSSLRKVFCFVFSRKRGEQRKVAFGDAARLFFSRVRRRDTQNGRFLCEPPVYSAARGKSGGKPFSANLLVPQSLLFLMKRKRSLLII